MKAKLRDTELYFDVEGSGLVVDSREARELPVAMLIHGGPGADHTGYKPLYSHLSDVMQLVYFDHRGQGRSARGDATKYTLDENVEDMEALRRHLGLGPIISIGTSYGGMVAQAHAARYPNAVSKLILIVTVAHGAFIPRAQQIVAERGTPEQKRVCEKLWGGSFQTADEVQEFYDVMGPLYSTTYKHSPEPDRRSREPSLEPMNHAFGPGGFLRSFDLRPELGRITAPTLILGGRHDWICAPEFSEEIHRLIPGSKLEIFEDSDHSLRMDQPGRLIGAIRDFVR